MAAPDEPRAAPPVAGAPRIPGYEIVAEVGRGGFATVYAAEQPAVAGRVAIKVINAADPDHDAVLRFQREAAALGALRGHPHIITVFDAGLSDDGRPYFVMDLLRAGSLHAELVRRSEAGDGPFAVEEVLDIGVKVASAVAAAHGRGILHRDLKPGNVLRSDYGEPVLGDFGVALLAEDTPQPASPREHGQALSAGYTAPEVIEGAQPSAKSDLFSLGCTLFALLTGSSPFRRPDDTGLLPALTRTVEAAVPDLRPGGVPDVVCRVLEQAMAKDPADRQADAAALGAALRDAQLALGLPPSPAPFPDRRSAPDPDATVQLGGPPSARVASPGAPTVPPPPPPTRT